MTKVLHNWLNYKHIEKYKKYFKPNKWKIYKQFKLISNYYLTCNIPNQLPYYEILFANNSVFFLKYKLCPILYRKEYGN